METKKLKAAELCGPEDRGSHVMKGSLVRRDGASWRIRVVRETHPGLMEIQVQAERPREAERHGLTSPRLATWSAKATDMFDVVMENILERDDPSKHDLKILPESEVYGFEVTGEDADAASEVLRSLGAWLDRQSDPPHHDLAPTGDGTTFEFRAERTDEGCRLFRGAHREATRQEGRFRLRVFQRSRVPQPPPAP